MMRNGSQEPDRSGNFLIKWMWRKPADTLAERTRRRVIVHLIPWLFFLYILAYLDRVNIGVAEHGMNKPPEEGGVGFDHSIIGLGSGIFFWGYWILEVPSTLSVIRWGARWVFIRILILWGLCTTLVAAIGTPWAFPLFEWFPGPNSPEYQFYFLRFMLGFFEGGFFPSVIVYLSLWFRPQDRAKAIAVFMAAIPFSNMIGNPFSGWILENITWFGLPGWRWIFIVQGTVPIVAGLATLFFLPDWPHKAKWLTPEEKDWLTGELNREQKTKISHGPGVLVNHLGMVVLLTVVYFCQNLTSYGLSVFMSSIIKEKTGVSSQIATLIAALPFLMALIGILVNGWHSDKTGERIWHVAVPLTCWSLGMGIASLVFGEKILFVLVIIFGVGTFLNAHLPAFWPIPTLFLGSTAAASAIGFINMIGNLGGSLGLYLVGKVADDANSFLPALILIAPFPLIAASIVLVVGLMRKRSSSCASANAG